MGCVTVSAESISKKILYIKQKYEDEKEYSKNCVLEDIAYLYNEVSPHLRKPTFSGRLRGVPIRDKFTIEYLKEHFEKSVLITHHNVDGVNWDDFSKKEKYPWMLPYHEIEFIDSSWLDYSFFDYKRLYFDRYPWQKNQLEFIENLEKAVLIGDPIHINFHELKYLP